MSVRLTAEHLQAIRAHGARTFPEECGGLLLGTLEADVRVIAEVMQLRAKYAPASSALPT